MTSEKIIRRSEEKGEAIQKALADLGYAIDSDGAIRRIIRSIESVLKDGTK